MMQSDVDLRVADSEFQLLESYCTVTVTPGPCHAFVGFGYRNTVSTGKRYASERDA